MGNQGTLIRIILGYDNRGCAGIDKDAFNEPENQLAGIDFTFLFGLHITTFLNIRQAMLCYSLFLSKQNLYERHVHRLFL